MSEDEEIYNWGPSVEEEWSPIGMYYKKLPVGAKIKDHEERIRFLENLVAELSRDILELLKS